MTDPIAFHTLAATLLGALAMLALTVLAAWNRWIGYLRLRLERTAPPPETATLAARIEIADLKERIRKLEAIAAGVDP